MLQTEHLHESPQTSAGGPRQRLRRLLGAEEFTLWTPLRPEEIAIELRPFLVNQAAPWDPGPRLTGRLGHSGMNLRWLKPRGKSDASLYVDYHPTSTGTDLTGVVLPSKPAFFPVWVYLSLSSLMLVLGASSVLWDGSLSVTSWIMLAVVLTITVNNIAISRKSVRDTKPRFQRLLIDVLMAEDVGSSA